jgi:hypothetical protein
MIIGNRPLKSFAMLIVCSVVFAMAAPTFGQWRGGYRSRSVQRWEVDRLIRNAENRSDRFVMLFDRALDDSRLNGTIRENRLNDRARDLERELNVVRQEFNRTGNYYEIRSHIASVLSSAQGINNVMRNRRLNYMVEREWWMLRSDLNRLAGIYNLRQLG